MTNSQYASASTDSLHTDHLDVDGGTLAFDVRGRGPLVVLVHGIGDSRASYRDVATAVAAAGFTAARLDLRGCGASTTGWNDYSRTAVAGDILALIRRLGGPAVIVGHSLAGGAATIAAATSPDLVAGVVELAPFTRKQSFSLRALTTRRVRTGMTSLLGVALFGRISAWTDYLDTATPGEKPADWTQRLDGVRSMLGEPGRMAALRAMIRTNPADAGAELAHVSQPTVVVMGSQDPDWVDPGSEAHAIVDELPAGVGQVVMVDGAGHYPHYQQPDAVAAAVIDLARRVTPRA